MFAGDNEVINIAGNVLPELHRPGGGGVKNLFFEGHRKEIVSIFFSLLFLNLILFEAHFLELKLAYKILGIIMAF